MAVAECVGGSGVSNAEVVVVVDDEVTALSSLNTLGDSSHHTSNYKC